MNLSSIGNFFRASGGAEYSKGGEAMVAAAKTGAGVGAAVGAISGAVIEGMSAQRLVESQPVNSVTETWKTPVTQDQVIGKIPADYYTPNDIIGVFPHEVGQRNVTAPVPVTSDKGEVAWQTHTQTFTDHGRPVVQWQAHTLGNPVLNGYTQSDMPDNTSYQDHNGNWHTVQQGTWHRFNPEVQYNNLGHDYQTPDVHFETGVSVVGRTFLGALAGAAAGAVGGALVGVATRKLVEAAEKH